MSDRQPAHDPARMRISDADRHRVAEVLREAAGEGRIDLAELDDRLEATYAAKTYADLVPITLDLPSSASAVPAVAPAAAPLPAGTPARSERHVAIMSGFERKGVWQVPAELTVLAVMGGAELDLRRATFAAREVVLTLNAFMGGAHVVVGPDVHVVMEGTGIMGGYAGPADDEDEVAFTADSPTVRVRGVAIMGGVHVERRDVRRR